MHTLLHPLLADALLNRHRPRPPRNPRGDIARTDDRDSAVVSLRPPPPTGNRYRTPPAIDGTTADARINRRCS
jgi:hypothetical protein